MVTLIGANGSGKTTALQTISGLTRARRRGKILFRDRRYRKTGDKVAAWASCRRSRAARVSKLTVEENLKTGAYLRKDMAKIREDIRASTAGSRLEGAGRNSRARSPAASSRCSRSGAR